MPKLVLELDEATSRKLDEIVALGGTETREDLVLRLLPRWLERHRAFWEYVEVGRRDIREGRFVDHDEMFDELEVELETEVRAREGVAAE